MNLSASQRIPAAADNRIIPRYKLVEVQAPGSCNDYWVKIAGHLVPGLEIGVQQISKYIDNSKPNVIALLGPFHNSEHKSKKMLC